MNENYDFERQWLAKFSNCLEQVAGDEIRAQVTQGSEGLSMESSRQEIIAWSRTALQRLDDLTDDTQRHDIMTGCACQYPKEDLQEVRAVYQSTGDLDQAHRLLQERFENFLVETLKLEQALIDEIVGRGWGLAGIRQGNTIIATKIPKSGNLVAYMQETDPQKKRQLYCHCPRIRDALKTGTTIPATYCYCGAGFYKGIWEEILQQPVEVALLESVLKGDRVCKVAIHLP